MNPPKGNASVNLPNVLNVGIIGLGVGEAHLRAYLKHPACSVKALCDFDDNKRRYLESKYSGIAVTSDAATILEDPDINLVSVASYDNYHYDQVIRALGHNKHVYVEKPLCLFKNEAEHIRRVLNDRPHLQLSSNLVLRRTPRFKKLRDLIKKGDLGEIFSVEGDYNYGRIHKLTDGWRGQIPFYSVFFGGGVHLLDLILWLTGERVRQVFGYGNRICTEGTAFKHHDNMVALLTFESGMIGKITANFGCVYPHFHKLSVYGTNATFENGMDNGYLFKSREKGTRPDVFPYAYPAVDKGKMIHRFVDFILGSGDAPEVTADEFFETMSVCFALQQSVEENRPVDVDYI